MSWARSFTLIAPGDGVRHDTGLGVRSGEVQETSVASDLGESALRTIELGGIAPRYVHDRGHDEHDQEESDASEEIHGGQGTAAVLSESQQDETAEGICSEGHHEQNDPGPAAPAREEREEAERNTEHTRSEDDEIKEECP